MSFSTEVKQELVSLRIEKSCCMLSELNALTQSCALMTLHGRGQVSIAFSSENVTVAKRVFILLKKRLEINATPHFNKVERFGGRRVCVIRLSQGDTRKLMLSLHMLHDGAIQFASGKQLRQRLRAGLAVAYKFQVIAVLGRGDGALA